MEEQGIAMKELDNPLRVFGKEEVLARIDRAL